MVSKDTQTNEDSFAVFKMSKQVPSEEVCDATAADSSNSVGFKKNSILTFYPLRSLIHFLRGRII